MLVALGRGNWEILGSQVRTRGAPPSSGRKEDVAIRTSVIRGNEFLFSVEGVYLAGTLLELRLISITCLRKDESGWKNGGLVY